MVRTGYYEVEIAYVCPPADAGARIRLSTDQAALESDVRGTVMKSLPPPLRTQEQAEVYACLEWATLNLGVLPLQAGRQKLTFQALTKPGSQIMDLKQVTLRLLP